MYAWSVLVRNSLEIPRWDFRNPNNFFFGLIMPLVPILESKSQNGTQIIWNPIICIY